jgi:hypothetical protein
MCVVTLEYCILTLSLPLCYRENKKGQDGDWVEWVYLAKSKVNKHAGLGLFALREFRKGAVIGWYVGQPAWKSTVAGGPQIKDVDTFMKKLSGGASRDNSYDLQTRYIQEMCVEKVWCCHVVMNTF